MRWDTREDRFQARQSREIVEEAVPAIGGNRRDRMLRRPFKLAEPFPDGARCASGQHDMNRRHSGTMASGRMRENRASKTEVSFYVHARLLVSAPLPATGPAAGGTRVALVGAPFGEAAVSVAAVASLVYSVGSTRCVPLKVLLKMHLHRACRTAGGSGAVVGATLRTVTRPSQARHLFSNRNPYVLQRTRAAPRGT